MDAILNQDVTNEEKIKDAVLLILRTMNLEGLAESEAIKKVAEASNISERVLFEARKIQTGGNIEELGIKTGIQEREMRQIQRALKERVAFYQGEVGPAILEIAGQFGMRSKKITDIYKKMKSVEMI